MIIYLCKKKQLQLLSNGHIIELFSNGRMYEFHNETVCTMGFDIWAFSNQNYKQHFNSEDPNFLKYFERFYTEEEILKQNQSNQIFNLQF